MESMADVTIAAICWGAWSMESTRANTVALAATNSMGTRDSTVLYRIRGRSLSFRV